MNPADIAALVDVLEIAMDDPPPDATQEDIVSFAMENIDGITDSSWEYLCTEPGRRLAHGLAAAMEQAS